MVRLARDPQAQSATLQILVRGLATAGEAARLAGVSRQLADQWAKSAGIDWRKARHTQLTAMWRKLVKGEREPIRKAKLRSIAAQAKAEWDQRNGKAQLGEGDHKPR